MGILAKFWKNLARRQPITAYAKNKVMHGEIPIGTLSREKVHSYWKDDVNLLTNPNNPEGYRNESHRSEFLYEQIKSLNVTHDDTILEIGCNIGRNLNYLYQQGFHNLHGIEINPHAILLMKKYYPEMASHSTILVGSVEDKIKEIKEKQMLVTFSMAVLEHIHPTSDFIFAEMSRITSHYLMTIELENSYTPKVYPRDYGKIFTALGWNMILNKPVDKSDLASSGYIIRIFSRKVL